MEAKKYGLGQRGGDTFEAELPSGNTCLMRGLSVEDLLEMGILDEMDSLAGIVQTDHIDRVKGKSSGADAAAAFANMDTSSAEGRQLLLSLMQDKERWAKIIGFINKVVVKAVEEPQVYDPTQHDASAGPIHVRPGAIPVNRVDLPDKMVIMTRAIARIQQGVAAAEPFREGREGDVADVPDGEGLRDAA